MDGATNRAHVAIDGAEIATKRMKMLNTSATTKYPMKHSPLEFDSDKNKVESLFKKLSTFCCPVVIPLAVFQ